MPLLVLILVIVVAILLAAGRRGSGSPLGPPGLVVGGDDACAPCEAARRLLCESRDWRALVAEAREANAALKGDLFPGNEDGWMVCWFVRDGPGADRLHLWSEFVPKDLANSGAVMKRLGDLQKVVAKISEHGVVVAMVKEKEQLSGQCS